MQLNFFYIVIAVPDRISKSTRNWCCFCFDFLFIMGLIQKGRDQFTCSILEIDSFAGKLNCLCCFLLVLVICGICIGYSVFSLIWEQLQKKAVMAVQNCLCNSASSSCFYELVTKVDQKDKNLNFSPSTPCRICELECPFNYRKKCNSTFLLFEYE